jgi:glycosyltransferase involved in cell wall biosynthesis
MKPEYPSKVLITDGREIGGVRSFAEGLRAGFIELGIAVEIIPPSRILRRWRELRDPRILKILSTSAAFAAPFARRAICVAHATPRTDIQGMHRTLLLIASFKLANHCSGVQLVSVSHYIAFTHAAIFNVRTDAVIHNSLKPIYLAPQSGSPSDRCYVTYLGRLTPTKNLHRLLPSLRDLLDESPGLRVCIIGEGELRTQLEAQINGDARFEFKGTPDDAAVRDLLRRTRVFVSGNETEGLGITYLEALSQGCVVVMKASGGSIEIAPDKVGRSVQILPFSWERSEVLVTLRKALKAQAEPIDPATFSAKSAAESYLHADAKFSRDGRVHPIRASQIAPQLS